MCETQLFNSSNTITVTRDGYIVLNGGFLHGLTPLTGKINFELIPRPVISRDPLLVTLIRKWSIYRG